MFRAFLLAPAFLAAAAAAAQQPLYDSAFAGYQSYREEPVADWRTVNEEVARVGGHTGVVGGASDHAGHAGVRAPAAPPQGAQPPQRSAPKAPAAGGQHEHHREAR